MCDDQGFQRLLSGVLRKEADFIAPVLEIVVEMVPCVVKILARDAPPLVDRCGHTLAFLSNDPCVGRNSWSPIKQLSLAGDVPIDGPGIILSPLDLTRHPDLSIDTYRASLAHGEELLIHVADCAGIAIHFNNQIVVAVDAGVPASATPEEKYASGMKLRDYTGHNAFKSAY
ncbi:MAG: hypothetical protein ABI681_11485 [Gemmatimonadales bacterium]